MMGSYDPETYVFPWDRPYVPYPTQLALAERERGEDPTPPAPAEPKVAGSCPDTTKAGDPCKGKATSTGYCAGHSKARGMV